MENHSDTHTVTRTGRQPLERPAGRPNGQRPPGRHIHDVLTELTGTRERYESLRVRSGSMDERARLISVLHQLRAEAALVRTTLRRP